MTKFFIQLFYEFCQSNNLENKPFIIILTPVAPKKVIVVFTLKE
jgi:hypothetical protein